MTDSSSAPTTLWTSPSRLRVWASVLSGGAATVHAIAIDEHLREWWGYGIFFLFAAIAQMFYAVLLLLRPWTQNVAPGTARRLERWFYAAGIAGNLFLIALYLVTRIVGIPFFGPGAGRREDVTAAGVIAKFLEAWLVVLLFRLRRLDEEPDTSTTASVATRST